MFLPWRDMAPLPAFPELRVWTSLTERETETLRALAAGKQVIEVGAAFGFSTLVLASVAEHVWSIDPHTAGVSSGNFDLRNSVDMDRLSAGTLATLQANLVTTGLMGRVTICRELSQDYLAEELPGTANFAFIDGDHSFAACALDLRNCDRIMESGVICVHDYACEDCPGVREAVDEWGGQHDLVDSMAVITL